MTYILVNPVVHNNQISSNEGQSGGAAEAPGTEKPAPAAGPAHQDPHLRPRGLGAHARRSEKTAGMDERRNGRELHVQHQDLGASLHQPARKPGALPLRLQAVPARARGGRPAARIPPQRRHADLQRARRPSRLL